MPSGTVVKTTNKDVSGGYNVYTKDAFETDGSLIAIFAPTAANKDSYDREVKIKWKTGGKYVTYTFDLTLATLDGDQPTPPSPNNAVLTEDGEEVFTEDGDQVLYEESEL